VWRSAFGETLREIGVGPGWADGEKFLRRVSGLGEHQGRVSVSRQCAREREILAGHFQATRERAAATEGPLLVLHDTTEFSFTRQEKTAIGL
jgi:hypothetical protein